LPLAGQPWPDCPWLGLIVRRRRSADRRLDLHLQILPAKTHAPSPGFFRLRAHLKAGGPPRVAVHRGWLLVSSLKSLATCGAQSTSHVNLGTATLALSQRFRPERCGAVSGRSRPGHVHAAIFRVDTPDTGKARLSFPFGWGPIWHGPDGRGMPDQPTVFESCRIWIGVRVAAGQPMTRDVARSPGTGTIGPDRWGGAFSRLPQALPKSRWPTGRYMSFQNAEHTLQPDDIVAWPAAHALAAATG